LRGRGTDDEKVLKKRLYEAENAMKNRVWYDYIIINDDLEKAQEEARAIVLSQRCRTSRQAPKITDLFGFSF